MTTRSLQRAADVLLRPQPRSFSKTRAFNDGTGVNESFITNAGPGPCLLALDSSHLYWTNQHGTTVGRSNLDGTGVNSAFIGALTTPCSVAVDSSFIYYGGGNGGGGIERANLDGNPASIDHNFIPGPFSGLCGIAVDASHIYWGTINGIGRADLNGGNPDPNFLPGAANSCGVAVDGSHIYWANEGAISTTIGRANLDGNPASVDNNFIPGGDLPCGVTIFNGKLYWANYNNGTIGRANLDGTNITQTLVTGAHQPCGPVVNAPSDFSFALRGKRLIVSVVSPGTATVSDASAKLSATSAKKKRKLLLKPSSASGQQPSITVSLRLSKLGKSKLRSKGKLKVRARITFAPDGGTAKTQTAKLTIKSKSKH